MDKIELDELKQRFKKATSWWYFFSKFMDITLGKIQYTNSDIDELIEYYEKKEQYKLCEKLIRLKKNNLIEYNGCEYKQLLIKFKLKNLT